MILCEKNRVVQLGFSQLWEIPIPNPTFTSTVHLGKGILKGIELIEKGKNYYNQISHWQTYSVPVIG
ncbi:MAG: hypothetical protein ABGW77_06620 [Campylobacterales bacterium]